MPATKKKAPAAKHTQSKQTKSKTGIARLAPKKGFQIWTAALVVVLVAAVGYGVVRYSQAGSNIAKQCYALHTKANPNPTNQCNIATETVSGDTGDLITLSDWPTYPGFTGRYTTGDQICVTILRERAPLVDQGGGGTQTGTKSDGSAPTPNGQVSVALTLKSNPATQKVLTVQKYGQPGSLAGISCVRFVGSEYVGDWDYRDAIDTPGGIQVKVLQGKVQKMYVKVSPYSDIEPFDLDVFGTE
jgi:hypothetical protein